MSGRLLEGATEICRVAGDLTRHVLWYLSHQIDGDGARNVHSRPIA